MQEQHRAASGIGGSKSGGGQRSRSSTDAFRELGPKLQPVLTKAIRDFSATPAS